MVAFNATVGVHSTHAKERTETALITKDQEWTLERDERKLRLFLGKVETFWEG